MPKSIENTVFVRFVPAPAHNVMRHTLEDIFSQVGPIKKSSWIAHNRTKEEHGGNGGGGSKGYGFVKYLTQTDANTAEQQLNNAKIDMEGKQYTLKVEVAAVGRPKATSTNKAGGNGPPGVGKQQQQQQQQQQQRHQPDGRKMQSTNEGAGAATAPAGTSNNTDTTPTDEERVADHAIELKKKSRIIVRNLSFYAKESQIRTAMETHFGTVTDVHIPRVHSKLHVGFCFVTFAQPQDAQHAVTAKTVDIAKRAVTMQWSVPKHVHQQQQQKAKHEQQRQKEQQQQENKIITESDKSDSADSGSANDNDSESDSDSDSNSNSDSDSDDSNEEDDNESSDEEASSEDGKIRHKKKDTTMTNDTAVETKCTLFVRNLPFDTTRNDLFQLFYTFGHIKGIYLVKDKQTGLLKGTAFVTYSKPTCAHHALEQAAAEQRNTSGSSGNSGGTPFLTEQGAEGMSTANTNTVALRGSFNLKGRTILVDLAVNKETAATMYDSKEYKIPHADRRNLYLQTESRVDGSNETEQATLADNIDTWEDLPQQDQRKRQTALKDKTAKLQSPIFFINPCRLSFRNMAKHINESQLRSLLETSVQRGLQSQRVTVDDQIAHWRAIGDMSTREILTKVQELERTGQDIIPKWNYDTSTTTATTDETNNEDATDGNSSHTTSTKQQKKNKFRNIKEYIPSVYIDRDYGPNGKNKKAEAPSRGFAFAEFTHHVHALACLRELNNNSKYSREYAAGGKNADNLKKKKMKKSNNSSGGSGGGGTGNEYRGEDGRVRVPRLVVDFVVENKVKAKKQAERRLHQQLNQSKQMLTNLEKKAGGDHNSSKAEGRTSQKEKRRGRGAIQRDKKRQKRESGEEDAEREKKLLSQAMIEARKVQRKEYAEQKKKRAEDLKRNSVKPPKKKKSKLKKIEDDEEFETIVRSYTSKLQSESSSAAKNGKNSSSSKQQQQQKTNTNSRSAVNEKRWFD